MIRQGLLGVKTPNAPRRSTTGGHQRRRVVDSPRATHAVASGERDLAFRDATRELALR